jgi:hypothetical protein
MKPKIFENTLNRERVICDNAQLSQWVDGVEYIAVHKENSSRVFLMRRDVLKPVTKQQQLKK